MKVDKANIEAMRDAMRQATQLIRSRGPIAATKFIQNLFRSGPLTADIPRANSAEQFVEVLDPLPAREPQVPEPPATLPQDSGQFVSKRFSSAVGSRNYKLYVPSSYASTPLPLIVMLHGCTQDPDDFSIGTRANRWAESKQVMVAYPEQIQRANAHRCWNWFRPLDQHADRGEPAIIAGITQQVLGEYRIDPTRVYVAGLSAGGAMAAIMGRAYPDLFAAIGVHSGLPVGVARDVHSALALMKTGRLRHAARADAAATIPGRAVPTIVLHGDADQTVNPANADRLIETAVEDFQKMNPSAPLQSAVQAVEARPGAHGYRRTIYTAGNTAGVIEQLEIHGAGHAWSGGDGDGSYTDLQGPDATYLMLEFFNRHVMPADQR